MTIAGYLAACDRMTKDGTYYDNSVPGRCLPRPHNGRDCSTFVAEALIDSGYPDVNPCQNSYGFAVQCYNQLRPDWFTARFGQGQGTFITHEQALEVVCWGLEGQDFGRRPFPGNRAHIETSLGNGGGSVGAHSHATGVGYSTFDSHNLNWFAVPPMFLAEMAPPIWKVQPQHMPPIQIAAELQNPQGGRWEALPDGRVRYVNRKGDLLVMGLDPTKPEWAAFHSDPNRQVAHLKLRWYRPKGSLLKKAGYTIVATDGNTYTPAAQH